MSCYDHRTARDFSYVTAAGVRLWRCSFCDRAPESWGPGWDYYGPIECMRCGAEPIEHVRCPDCSKAGKGPTEERGGAPGPRNGGRNRCSVCGERGHNARRHR